MYQTDLYAQQKDVNMNFTTDKHELQVFIGNVICMDVCSLPSIEDYRCTFTRVPQVADVTSSKCFRLIRSLLHFRNNEHSSQFNDIF